MQTSYLFFDVKNLDAECVKTNRMKANEDMYMKMFQLSKNVPIRRELNMIKSRVVPFMEVNILMRWWNKITPN